MKRNRHNNGYRDIYVNLSTIKYHLDEICMRFRMRLSTKTNESNGDRGSTLFGFNTIRSDLKHALAPYVRVRNQAGHATSKRTHSDHLSGDCLPAVSMRSK